MVPLFVQWLYFDAPRAHTVFFRDLLTALYNYFSISLLTQTLLDPWRHDAVDMSRLPLAEWGRAMANNFVSRFIGFMLRLAVIMTGLITLFITFIIAAIYTLAWYALPLLLILSFFYGIAIMLGGFNA